MVTGLTPRLKDTNIDDMDFKNNAPNIGTKLESPNNEIVNTSGNKTMQSEKPLSKRDTDFPSNTSNISKIPRYVRNPTAGSISNGSSAVTSAVSSPVQRKLLNKQQQRDLAKHF